METLWIIAEIVAGLWLIVAACVVVSLCWAAKDNDAGPAVDGGEMV